MDYFRQYPVMAEGFRRVPDTNTRTPMHHPLLSLQRHLTFQLSCFLLWLWCFFFFAMSEAQLLVLGPEGVGKTVMLKRLQTLTAQQNLAQAQQKEDFGEAPSTIPTIGVNLVTVTHNKRKYTFRELGGAMGPIWSNYFKDAGFLVYVIDTAKRTQVASTCIQLLEVLASKETHEMPVLLIFNKIDSPDCMSMSEISTLIRLPDIVANARQDITVLECSFREGTGLHEILKWLQETCSLPSAAKY